MKNENSTFKLFTTVKSLLLKALLLFAIFNLGSTQLQAQCPTPTGLSNGLISATSATINWNNMAGAIYYKIRYRVQTPVGAWVNTTSTPNTKFIVGLTQNTTYEYQVKSVCNSIGNESGFSSSATFTTGSQCAIPTNLAIVSLTATTTTLSWSGTGTWYSTRYRTTSPFGSWVYGSSVPTSKIFAGLIPNTSYEFQVASNCSSDPLQSPFSASLIVKTFCSSYASFSNSISACDSYTWSVNGATYTNSGTYKDTNTTCQINTLNLTINNSSTSSSSATACDTYTWSCNGTVYTASGTYTCTSMNAAGCVNTATLNLTINNSSTSSTSATACDTYTWSCNSATYTNSGTWTCTSLNAAGCVHTETLDLTINNSTAHTTYETACDSYTWSCNSATYTNSGTWTCTSMNAAGCVHTETLDLTINNSTSHTTYESACDSYSWSCNGITYTASGSYTCTSMNAAGCEHTETLDLTINASPVITSTSATPSSICAGQTSQLDVQTTGCPTSCTYNMTSIPLAPTTPVGPTNPGPVGDDNVSGAIPIGFPFTFHCNTYTQLWISTNGYITFSDPFGNSGCCSGQFIPDAYNPNNLIAIDWTDLATAGFGNQGAGDIDYYTLTSPNRMVIRYNNVGTYAAGGNVTGEIILYDNGSVEIHSSSITTAHPNQTQGLENDLGTIATVVSGRNSTSWTTSGDAYRFTPTSATSCTYSWSPAVSLSNASISNPIASLSASETYTVSVTSASGCTATSTVTVNVTPNTTNVTTTSSCDTYTWSVDGQTYTVSGSYNYVNPLTPCHTETLDLTINNSTAHTTYETACDSYTWSCNSATYTNSGTWTCTSLNAAGCVHTETLDLTINNSTANTINVSACVSYTWTCNGMMYTNSGSWTCTSINAAGCLHTETLNLVINALPTVTASDVSGCPGSSVPLVGNPAGGTFSIANPYLGSSTTYTYTYTDANGCTNTSSPALVTVNLAVPIYNFAVSQVTGSTVLATWTSTPGVTWYQLRYKPVSSSTWSPSITQSAPTNQKYVTGLNSNTQYEIQIKGFCGSNVTGGPWSTSAIFTTDAPCNTPTGLTVSNITNTNATLNWNPAVGAAYYGIRYKKTSASVWTMGTSTPTMKLLTGLTPGAQYEFQVQSYCGTPTPGPYTASIVWTQATTIPPTAGGKIVGTEEELISNVNIYPNPTSNVLNIDLMVIESSNTIIKVLDMSGRLIKQTQVKSEKGLNPITIDLSELASGIYALQILENEKVTHISKVEKK